MAKNPPENRSFKKPKVVHTPPLSVELIEKIANAIRLGNYVETACALYGVHKSKLYEWLRNAAANPDPDTLEYKLQYAVDRALAESETRDLQRVDMAADGRDAEFLRDDDGKLIFNDKGDPIVKRPALNAQWAAAAWKLERKFPRKWGRMERVEHSGPDGKAIKIHEMTLEELKAERARLRAIIDDPGAK